MDVHGSCIIHCNAPMCPAAVLNAGGAVQFEYLSARHLCATVEQRNDRHPQP